jgi:integrase
MATIEKRTHEEGVTYRVKVRLKGYPTQTASFARLTDAKRWAQHTESAIREGRHFKKSESKRHTLTEAIDRYIKEILPNKPRSARSQALQLAWWKTQLGDYALGDITPALIGQYRENLSQDKNQQNKIRTPATVNRYLAVLSHVFTVLVKEWGWAEENPLYKVSKKKEPRGRVRFLSEDERKRLLDECKKSDSKFLYTAVVLALSTGARQMEILGLSWDDVDLNRGIITLHQTKNNEIRILHIAGLALELMKKHAQVRHLQCDLVFPGKDFKNPIDLRTPFETALKRAEIKDFRWHDLRHSCASYLIMNGASIAEIAEILGHKTLQMVKRYAHLSDAHTSKVVARMNEKIFGGEQG